MSIATHGSGNNKDQSVQGDLAVGGALAVTGNAAITGNAAVGGALTVTGATASGVTAILKDGAGMILLATGTTVPTDSGAGYAKGCLFIDTDVAAGTTGLYVNVGTTAACNFDAVSDA